MTSPNLTNPFFDQPVLNSPHKGQSRCWELDEKGEPTQEVKESRRSAEFITPNPKPKKRKGSSTEQSAMVLDELVPINSREGQ